MQIPIADAKAHFAELVRRAEAGEEIELTRYGRPVARIVASRAAAQTPLIGAMRGGVEIAPDFDDLPAEFLAAFGASPLPE